MFRDRAEAGRRLARQLHPLRAQDPVVVGLPRGGVPVAAEVARDLGAPLDVIIVRKLGVPYEPELAMGAIGEDGVRVVDEDIVRATGVGPDELAAVEATERRELERRARVFRAHRVRIPLAGRVVVVVDDGLATGSTARAACAVARAEGARRVVLAVPVAPVGWTRTFEGVADELICLATPQPFFGIGRFYDDFAQTSDADVLACLDRCGMPRADPGDDPPARDDEVELTLGSLRLGGQLTVPGRPSGLVVFAHGSGSSRHSSRNRFVARLLNRAGLATLLFDLLTADEEQRRENVVDIDLLGSRLGDVTR